MQHDRAVRVTAISARCATEHELYSMLSKPHISHRVNHIPVEVMVDGKAIALSQIGAFFGCVIQHCNNVMGQLWPMLNVEHTEVPGNADYAALIVQDSLEHHKIVMFQGSTELLTTALDAVRIAPEEKQHEIMQLLEELEKTLAIALHIGCGPPARGEETMRATYVGNGINTKTIYWSGKGAYDVVWQARPRKANTDDVAIKFPAPMVAEILLLICGVLAPAHMELLHTHEMLNVVDEGRLFLLGRKNQLSDEFRTTMLGPSFKDATGFGWPVSQEITISQYRAIASCILGGAELKELAKMAEGHTPRGEACRDDLLAIVAKLMGHSVQMHESGWYSVSSRLPDGSSIEVHALEAIRNATGIYNALVGIPDEPVPVMPRHTGRDLDASDLTSEAGLIALRKCVGDGAAWREGQKDMLMATFSRLVDVLVLMDVGCGKSLLWQWAAVMMMDTPEIQTRTYLVIAPTRTLLADQALRLRGLGVRVFELKGNEGTRASVAGDFHEAMTRSDGPPHVVIATLEMLTIPRFQATLCKYTGMWAALVVDEAHIVFSQDTLSSYGFALLRTALGRGVPLVALSATIPVSMEPGVKTMLHMQDTCERICISANSRPHVKYIVERHRNLAAQKTATIKHAKNMLALSGTSNILIACATKREVASVAALLLLKLTCVENASILSLTADSEERGAISESWIAGRARVLVLTSALAVGINSISCAGVIVYSSTNIVNTIQAFGRAGRAGQGALAVLLYKSGDAESMTWVKRPRRLQGPAFDALYPMSVHEFANDTDCIRCRIGAVLGVELDACDDENFCSACAGAGNTRPVRTPDPTSQASEPEAEMELANQHGRQSAHAQDVTIATQQRTAQFAILTDTRGPGILQCVFCRKIDCGGDVKHCDYLKDYVKDLDDGSTCFRCHQPGHYANSCKISEAFRTNGTSEGVVHKAYCERSMCALCLSNKCERGPKNCDDRAVKQLIYIIIASGEVRTTLHEHVSALNSMLMGLDFEVIHALNTDSSHDGAPVNAFLAAMAEPVDGGCTGFMILGAWWHTQGREAHKQNRQMYDDMTC